MKTYIVLTLFTTLSVAAVVILYLVENDTEDDATCENGECETVDVTKDADERCDDFYSFACKNFSKTFTKCSVPVRAYSKQMIKIVELLKNKVSTNTSQAFNIARKFYNQCRHVNEIGNLSNKLVKLFNEMGGFPTLEGKSWDDSKWSLLESTKKIRQFGLFTDSFFTTSLGFNPLSLKNVTFHLNNPKLVLAQNEKLCRGPHGCFASYTFQYVDLLMKFGADRKVATEDGLELFYFEKRLLNLFWENMPRSTESVVKDKVKTLADLSSSFGYLNWTEYFTILLGSRSLLQEDLVIVVENPGFLSGLKSAIEEVPKRTLANFMMWSVLFRIKKFLPGYKRSSKDCVQFLQTTLSFALQSMYAEIDDSSSSKKAILDITTMIQEEFLSSIRRSNWLHYQAKRDVYDKIEQLQIKVGLPKVLLNPSFIDGYYSNLFIGEDVLTSMLNLQKFHVDKQFSLCCREVDERLLDLTVDVYTPLVYYNTADNSVRVLPGALVDPIFNPDWSVSENFGRIGSLFAHEIFHAVDSIGYRYDNNGKLRKQLSDPDYSKVENKFQCYVDQYNKLMDLTDEILTKNPMLSGNFKKLELVADSVGVDLSFRAFQRYELYYNRSGNVSEGRVFTPEQRFFLSYAQLYCVSYSDDDFFHVLLDESAPNPYRVIPALQNSEYFSKVFNCSLGSEMNPKSKCTLW